ncbi:RagB/SusD family nutrient uptake outer membrane protein [Formosa haliotis]|uniref:RagB/SusD family nutrient uptake outer membrane protein n=1 Tax=Formosa haliotis TaxID=1555194 RepID=UPI0008257148|nr:RagB/SusD family nutrient uptake outer membrane protein [Formosa haliotis]
MKKVLYIVLCFQFFGCSDFLDEVSQDKLIPEKTDHYAALLLGEFNYQYPIFGNIDYMTDNIVEDAKAFSSRKFNNKTTYTWQREIEIDEDGNTINNINSSWERMYEDIAIANYIIAQIDEAIGEQSEIDNVKGEAYFVRALSYFNLLNLYGQPYDAASANFDLGVPLRDDIGVEFAYSRNTVAECYALIESDLEHAIDLIGFSGLEKSIWHPNAEACNLLMSRVKLYQEKWQEAIDYADQVIAQRNLTKISPEVPFVTDSNDEILYSYYTVLPLFQLYSSGSSLNTLSYFVNPELVNLYDDADVRKDAFFLEVSDATGKATYRTKKYQTGLFTDLGYANLRVSEAYLNRAEAYAQLGNSGNALADIRTLHGFRYNSTADIVYPDNGIVEYVLLERRKEFCFEDHHRWFDLRRMENRPEIKHVYSVIEENGATSATEIYTLLSDDINYTLPIPLEERENNPQIRNNERYEKIPIIED